MTRHKPFKHAPLATDPTQIRLLRLNDSLDRNGLIKGEIEHHDLSSIPPYVAISYCWGEDKRSISILISNRLLKIRTNLYDLLRILVKCPPQPRFKYLWIDQICIDQSNIRERNHQVQYMQQIYQNAECVYAWLGSAENDSDRAMRLIASAKVDDKVSKLDSHLRLWSPDDIHQPLRDLFRRDYWYRLWIVQEIVLAKQVIVLCGQHCVSLEKMQAYCWTGDAEKLIDSRLYQPGEAHFALWAAIAAFHDRSCEDNRDMIFGLQGIVVPAERVPIDYAIHPIDLYMNTVHLLLAQQKILHKKGNPDLKETLPLLGEAMNLIHGMDKKTKLRELIVAAGRGPIAEEDWALVLPPGALESRSMPWS